MSGTLGSVKKKTAPPGLLPGWLGGVSPGCVLLYWRRETPVIFVFLRRGRDGIHVRTHYWGNCIQKVFSFKLAEH